MIKKLFSNKKYIFIISILGILLVSGITYAIVNWTSNNYNIAIKSSCMNINYTKGQDIDKNLGVIDESLYISGNTITMNSAMAFSSVDVGINSACDVNGLATVEINVTSLSNDLKSGGKYYGGLKYVVVEYDPTDYNEFTMSELTGHAFTFVGKGIIYNTGTIDVYTTYIEHGREKNYLIIFYADKDILKNDLVDLSFDGSIGARVEQFVPTPITDFTYTLTNGYVRITRYNGTATKVNLAPTYTINGVSYNTVVYGGVFSNKTTVQEVNFADGITADNGYAYQMFYWCTNLIKVSGLPNNITNLSYGFYNCTRLVNAPLIPNSVTNMSNTYRGCSNLLNIPYIGTSVSDLSYAFYGCSQLKNVSTIPSSVTNMNYAFQNCTSLVNAPIFGNSVQNMQYTFSGCSQLKNVSTIPNSVTNMNYAFQNCTSLVDAPILGNSVQNMQYTFSGCTNLLNAPAIPSSVTNMTSTFKGCTDMTGTIRINSTNVTRTSGVSYHPFYNTTKPITVEVPSGSTTYTKIYNNKPSNVTISTFTS